MPKAFEGMVSSRSSTSAAGPPGEQVILELNPERREKLLELTSWRSLYPGTLNLEVDDAVLELLRDSETAWVEDAHEVRYPDSWQHIPKLRKAYLYYQGTVVRRASASMSLSDEPKTLFQDELSSSLRRVSVVHSISTMVTE
jgi:hypothetical protein